MSSGSRGSALRRIAAALLALGSLVVPPPSPAQAKVAFDETAKKFIITVPIDLIGGEDDIAAEWEDAIRKHWNNGPGLFGKFKYCGKSVEFVPDIKPIAAGQAGRPDAAKIRMQLAPPGEDVISNVRGLDPARNSTGTWGSNEDDATIAHEFGHILGLPDEYRWVPYTDSNTNGRWDAGEPKNDDLNHNGKRDPGEPTHPIPGNEGSIMAEHRGKVLQRHIDKVMDRPGIKCWKGSIHSESTSIFRQFGGFLTCTEIWDTEVSVLIGPDGVATGTATGTLDRLRNCHSNFGWDFTNATTFSADVSGKVFEDRLEIRLQETATDGSNQGLLNYTLHVVDPPLLSIPITAPGVAEATVTVERSPPGSGYTATGIHTVELSCESCVEDVG